MDKYFEALEKAKKGIDLSGSFINQDQTASDALFLDELEKGRKAQIGEIRTWSGKKYQKTTNGWRPVKTGARDGGSKEESEEKKPSALKTDAWNENISIDQLPEKYKGFAKEALENIEGYYKTSGLKVSAYISSSQEETEDDTEIVIEGKIGTKNFTLTMQNDGSGEVSVGKSEGEFESVDDIVDTIDDLR